MPAAYAITPVSFFGFGGRCAGGLFALRASTLAIVTSLLLPYRYASSAPLLRSCDTRLGVTPQLLGGIADAHALAPADELIVHFDANAMIW